MALALGVISGTSVDGVDAALVETDGRSVSDFGPAATFPYRAQTQAAILAAVDAGGRPDAETFARLSRAVEDDHLAAMAALAREAKLALRDLDVIGFHGQTIFHDPAAGVTSQLGDPARIAARAGARVVGRLREADMAAGGQGAPIVPVYHAALAQGWETPVAFLNAGGVANLTLVTGEEAGLAACDVGPANAPLDDWMRRRFGRDHDAGGAVCAAGRVDEARVAAAVSAWGPVTFGPRALDRNAATWRMAEGLSPEDGAATLIAISAEAAARAARGLSPRPLRWFVCGGGRLNPIYLRELRARLDAPVEAVETAGLDGDAIEAQAMAFIAARTLAGLPSTFPGTTGCRAPTVSGRAFHP
ncbi:anhydro-N-acetylmuramic acid kinase [Rubrimonas cliftonensis]|uniref:Anhydro-N-acetylmuramic acid kinase n=1 Tax=Rubrimonas cliftonensis TaxID=89524 RepID=A0A1H3W4Q8_9RHOB|nr:anhydro-N-acetylmuramic acid kinase [Rubrimonas cliftonensis]SDZ82067.1 anhydro-N-acetylmuramic acid kinase [Rubrimonas cliftonensis]